MAEKTNNSRQAYELGVKVQKLIPFGDEYRAKELINKITRGLIDRTSHLTYLCLLSPYDSIRELNALVSEHPAIQEWDSERIEEAKERYEKFSSEVAKAYRTNRKFRKRIDRRIRETETTISFTGNPWELRLKSFIVKATSSH